jgi:hypothetical protein
MITRRNFRNKDFKFAGHKWLTPVIPAIQEAEVRRTVVPSQSWANSLQDPISKNPS